MPHLPLSSVSSTRRNCCNYFPGCLAHVLSHLSLWLIWKLPPLAPPFRWKTETVGGYLIGLGGSRGSSREKATAFWSIHPSAWKSWGLSGIMTQPPWTRPILLPPEPGPLSAWTPAGTCTLGYPRCHLHKTESMTTRFKMKDLFTLQSACNESRVVQSSLCTQRGPCYKPLLFMWPCHRPDFKTAY